MELQDLFATHEFRKEALQMFFRAMRENGWAFDTHTGEPFKCGSWVISDTWSGNKFGRHSAGETLMSYAGVDVWKMQYFGWYSEEAIPCVKAALRDTYTRGEFIGGRGKHGFRHKGMSYLSNLPESGLRSFNLFRGTECVWKDHSVQEQHGEHFYHGGFLLPPL